MSYSLIMDDDDKNTVFQLLNRFVDTFEEIEKDLSDIGDSLAVIKDTLKENQE